MLKNIHNTPTHSINKRHTEHKKETEHTKHKRKKDWKIEMFWIREVACVREHFCVVGVLLQFNAKLNWLVIGDVRHEDIGFGEE